MILQALLVSRDDLTAETLLQEMALLGIAANRSEAGDVAVARLGEEHFDLVVIDFDSDFDADSKHATAASALLEACRRLACRPDRNPPISIALLKDASRTRAILSAGAHFILSKPLAREQAHESLLAASAVLKRERRQALRVAVQAAVCIDVGQHQATEAILLDLSTSGMDVLSAKPLVTGAAVRVAFDLPEGAAIGSEAEVSWSAANGQSGLRFVRMDTKTQEQLNAWLGARSHDSSEEDADAISSCHLTDLSLGGCYVETRSPFPQGSAVDLCLRAAGLEIHSEGLVRIMHPGHGMGIEFPARTEEQRARVAQFIELLADQPGATPQLEASLRGRVGSGGEAGTAKSDEGAAENATEDPLLELLRTGNGLEEEAFLAEMHGQRSVASAGQ